MLEIHAFVLIDIYFLLIKRIMFSDIKYCDIRNIFETFPALHDTISLCVS